ncbi:MarR family winged helix-turn-helix transcriptional regulator [Nonomuraea sp. NPDC050691]|uniref:MarR family winged helix-turn-helix transcriptional regulator n=1 Tax=Nonomuraea sp. NPDC050691 TaxID=3155661 RepID=UPI0033F9F3DA
MEPAPARLRGKPSWLINKTSLHAQRLIGEVLNPLDARGYHFAILAALEEFGPASQIAIGQRCGIDRSDTHATVNELADQGLIVRAPDPADRRRNVITLTPAGQRRLEQLDTILTGVQEELLSALSEAERGQFLELLRRVFDHATRRSS